MCSPVVDITLQSYIVHMKEKKCICDEKNMKKIEMPRKQKHS